MSWSTSLGFGVWLGAVVAKSSRQSGPGLRNHTLIDLTSCPLQASVVPLYPPLRPVRTPNGMLSNQPSSAFSGPTNPPNFHGNRKGLCQGQLQPSQEEHCASDASFEPRSTQDQQQQHQQQAAPDTTAACRLILTRFRAGALFPTTVLSFPSINISALDRYSHQPFVHHTRYTRSLSQRSTTTHPHSGDSSFRRDPNTQSVADPVMTTAGLTDKHSIGPPQFGTPTTSLRPAAKPIDPSVALSSSS